MSMLAEPRQRKTYNLVPRGKALYNDDSRFGTKMLTKMGWNKETGLGAREDGSMEFIRIHYKNNVKGLGYELRDDQWTQHEKNFSGLLENLNGTTEERKGEDDALNEETARAGFGCSTQRKMKSEKLTEKISGESLEEKSKSSKARVHYKKFTRGKDLSRYSEKDLANIFGKKAEQSSGNAIYEQFTAITVDQSNSEDEKEEEDNFAGVQTVNTGVSVTDYFKQKMEAMRNKLKTKPDESIEHDQAERVEATSEVGRKRARSPAIEDATEEQLPKKKKKKSKKDHNIEDNDEQTNSTESQGVEEQANDKTGDKKKSKKKLKSKSENVDSEETYSIESQVDDEQLNPDLTADIKKKNKKKSKKSKSTSENDESPVHSDKNDTQPINPNENELQLCSEVVDELNGKRKKIKKSSKIEKDESSEKKVSSGVNNNVDSESTDCKAPNQNDNAFCSGNIDKSNETRKTSKRSKVKKDQIFEKENDHVPQVIMEDSTTQNAEFNINAKALQDSSDTPALQSLEEMREHMKNFDELAISTFSAERFRNCQLQSFEGSNLANVTGYSLSANLQLKISKAFKDDEKILELWSGKINKYDNQNTEYTYSKYVKGMHNARRRNAKAPHLHVKAWKRKQLFKAI